MKAEAPWRSRQVRAAKLRAMCDQSYAANVLLSRHIIDQSRAVFELGRPGSSVYFAEIACLRAGVFVHGDIDSVIFERCSEPSWKAKLCWLRGDNYDYAEEKAQIGATCSEMAQVVDVDIAIGDLLYWRREGTISKDDAADIYRLLGNNDARVARDEFYARTGDYDIRLGTCTAHRVIAAQAMISRLCELLEAAGVL